MGDLKNRLAFLAACAIAVVSALIFVSTLKFFVSSSAVPACFKVAFAARGWVKEANRVDLTGRLNLQRIALNLKLLVAIVDVVDLKKRGRGLATSDINELSCWLLSSALTPVNRRVSPVWSVLASCFRRPPSSVV